MNSVTSREIKEAFVLADRMKNGPFDELSKFQESLRSQREQVQNLTIVQLDEKLREILRELNNTIQLLGFDVESD